MPEGLNVCINYKFNVGVVQKYMTGRTAGRTTGRTDGQPENIMSSLSSRRRHKNEMLLPIKTITLSDFIGFNNIYFPIGTIQNCNTRLFFRFYLIHYYLKFGIAAEMYMCYAHILYLIATQFNGKG